MKRLGILLSGRGSNFLAISDSIKAGRLAAEIGLVVSNVAEAAGLARARELGYPTLFLPSRDVEREEYDRRVVDQLQQKKVDYVCLAGFMRLLSAYFVRAYFQRIVNIHPSLLPAFPGLHAQRQALEHGVRYSGCTVHLVDEGLDCGPILLQAVVPVRDDDTEETLSARILEQEHRIYSEALALLTEGKFVIEGRRARRKAEG